jgi:hypothetical protein
VALAAPIPMLSTLKNKPLPLLYVRSRNTRLTKTHSILLNCAPPGSLLVKKL